MQHLRIAFVGSIFLLIWHYICNTPAKYLSMKKLIIILLPLMAIACQKEDTRPACEKNNTATVKLTCTSNNPYEIYVNQKFVKVINPNTSEDLQIKAGSNAVQAVQASGYLISPTVRNLTRDFKQCSTTTFSFP